MKSTRICAGEYKLTDGFDNVRIFFHEECEGWIAAANWCRSLYTDPLPTKRAAMNSAKIMLGGREQ